MADEIEGVKESDENAAPGEGAVEALAAQVATLAKELKKSQAQAAKAAKAAEEATKAAEEARAEAAASKLNMGGNNLQKMNAWRMPPTAGHVKAGTTSKLPSGNAIVNG